MKRYLPFFMIALLLASLSCQKSEKKDVEEENTSVKKEIEKSVEEPKKPQAPQLTLPMNPVNATHEWMKGKTAEYDLGLSGIGQGYDLADGTYPGWCIEDNYQDNANIVRLYSSYDPNMPDDIKVYRDPSIPKNMTGLAVPWDKLNYLLNHKQGGIKDVGAAIFVLIWGKSAHFPVTESAQAMLNDAEANGSGFIPESGQIIAIVLYQDGLGDDSKPDDINRKYQDTIIEYTVP